MSLPKIVILFSGEGSNMENIIQTLHQKEVNVVACITNKAEAKGIQRAQAYHIPVEVIEHKDFNSREAFDEKLTETINKYTPELSVLAGFMRILTPVFTTQIKAINIHPSYLPFHKGANAIENSFKADEGKGISIHMVSAELDGGIIILQEPLTPKTDETLDGYTKRLHMLEYALYPEAIKKVLTHEH